MVETFYDRLGVPEDATVEEVKAAYRERIKEAHPDLNDDADAGERTRRLIRAKEVLTDADERSRYDRLGHEQYVKLHATGDATGDRDAGSTDGRAESSGVGDGETTGRQTVGDTAAGKDGQSAASATTDEGGQSVDDAATGRRTVGGATEPDDGRRQRAGRAYHSERETGAAGADGATRNRADTETTTGQRRTSAGRAGWSGNRANTNGPWARRKNTEPFTVGGDYYEGGYHPSRLFPLEQSIVLIGVTTVLYPVLLGSAVFPAFPLVVNVVVGVCTLLTVGYLLSLPSVAVPVFGLWAVVLPVAVMLAPGLHVASLLGLLVIAATWVPLGIAGLLLGVTSR